MLTEFVHAPDFVFRACTQGDCYAWIWFLNENKAGNLSSSQAPKVALWRTGLFVVDSHSKKRPHNLIFGRIFDHRLYDLLELGVEKFRSIKSFGRAGLNVQAGNKVPIWPEISWPSDNEQVRACMYCIG